jgi:hypothetical protein
MTRSIPLRTAEPPAANGATENGSDHPVRRGIAWPEVAEVWRQTLLTFGEGSGLLVACVVALAALQMMETLADGTLADGTLAHAAGASDATGPHQRSVVAALWAFVMPMIYGLVAWVGLAAPAGDTPNRRRELQVAFARWPALLGCWLVSVACAVYVGGITAPSPTSSATGSAAGAVRFSPLGPAFTFDPGTILGSAVGESYRWFAPGIPLDLAARGRGTSPADLAASDLGAVCLSLQYGNAAISAACYRRLPTGLLSAGLLSAGLPRPGFIPGEGNRDSRPGSPALALALVLQTLNGLVAISIVWRGEHGKRRKRGPTLTAIQDGLPRATTAVVLHLGLVQLCTLFLTVACIGLPAAMIRPAMAAIGSSAPWLPQVTELLSDVAAALMSSFFLVFSLLYSACLYATWRGPSCRQPLPPVTRLRGDDPPPAGEGRVCEREGGPVVTRIGQ